MAFFKSFQQTLPSVNISSILDSVSSRVDDLANTVSDVTYSVSDQLTEQVTTIISKVQDAEDKENGSSQEPGQASNTQEGRTGSKSMWQTQRDSNNGQAGAKTNKGSEAAEGGNTQLEWEWRDGCWRVKKSEAELAEEERKKKEEKEEKERREQRRKERRERQLEKEAETKRREEESNVEAAEASERTENSDGRDREAAQSDDQSAAQGRSDDGHETPRSPRCENETGESKRKEEEDGEQEEEVEDGSEREADNEEEGEPPKSASTAKKKKTDKKKEKGSSKKSEAASDGEKKNVKEKKSKKKKKGNQDGAVSDSEEENSPEAVTQQNTTSAWSRSRQSSEQGGYSSEASSEQATSIQRIKKESSQSESQPPPYKSSGKNKSCSSGRGVRRASSPKRCGSSRCSSNASVDQETESYLNKEEDIPSDSTAVLGPEDGLHLPAAYEPEPLAQYGTLDVAFEYDSSEQWLAVTVTAATDIPALKQTGNIWWQVHLVLLPTKKQRAKTGVQKGPCPVFTETFKFSRVEQEALADHAVRFRLYSIRRMKKEKVLGEKVFYLTKLNLQGKMALPVTLEPGSELTGCGSLVSVSRSAGALSYRSTEDTSLPEILLGLIYNSATGQLSAEVIQGSHFKTTASDKPVNDLFCCVKHFVGGQLYVMRDTYVKLTMLDSKGKEMSKRKTAVCRGQPNPTYKETFVFQVALFQLSEVSLVVTVFCRRSSMKPREKLGWVSLGNNSTSEEQQTHWTEMREAEGQQVCHWHTLTDT
ncbi:synaptotagmin-14 [Nematolebias whitei]|uniref:synaptotagmin-14 n=1 Tax=Nematolebias whitei TaxID=451745 RepID=UPI00189AD7CF|nr:synaptotagmin-14 [Nematolebias whitei]